MKLSRIKYDPAQSIEEIARNSNVSIPAVREYIKKRKIDRKCDEKLIKYRAVKRYRYLHPEAEFSTMARRLKMSVNTVKKYAAMTTPPMPEKGKRSAIEDAKNELMVAVSESEPLILRAILSNHLAGAATFRCDLTIGKGRFYKGCVALPDFLYDINPLMKNVRPLDEAKNLPDEVFESVVIDLPCTVVKPSARRKLNTFASFDSIDQLYSEYAAMIQLAWRLLKEGGVMVFKTADIQVDGKPLWTSDWSIQTAVATGFTLVDKYIYIDTKAINTVTTTGRKSTSPTHAYFLVFRKESSPAFYPHQFNSTIPSDI